MRLEPTVKPWLRILHQIVVWILSQPSHVLSCQPTSLPQLQKTRAGKGDPINRLELLFLLPSLELSVLILSKRLYCAFLYTFLLVLKYLSTNLLGAFHRILLQIFEMRIDYWHRTRSSHCKEYERHQSVQTWEEGWPPCIHVVWWQGLWHNILCSWQCSHHSFSPWTKELSGTSASAKQEKGMEHSCNGNTTRIHTPLVLPVQTPELKTCGTGVPCIPRLKAWSWLWQELIGGS